MKRILTLALLLLLMVASLGANSIKPPKGFAGKTYAGTFSLYGTRGTKTQFACTATAYETIPGGYHLLSAGHCIQTAPSDVIFSVSEDIGGPRVPVAVIKSFLGQGIDFAILELKTTKKYPVFSLGTEHGMRLGDRVINPNFADGLGKQISRGVVSSEELPNSDECGQACSGVIMVQIYGAPGSSGSPIISEKTHKIVGLLVASFQVAVGNVGFAMEPISRFSTFLSNPGQARPTEIDLHDPEDDDPSVTEPEPRP